VSLSGGSDLVLQDLIYACGSQVEAILPPGGYQAMSIDTIGCHSWLQYTEARQLLSVLQCTDSPSHKEQDGEGG
jgi:hypothetical protein